MKHTPNLVTAEVRGPEPDFMALDVQTTPDESGSGAEPIFPPTDPVIAVDQHGRPHVLGGFSSDSMASLEVEASAEDTSPGDEALADAVRRELSEDAATTGLAIAVFVRRGVVHLRGGVSDLEDADSAAAVAARLPGVRHVVEELDLPAFPEEQSHV
jgi:BON domain